MTSRADIHPAFAHIIGESPVLVDALVRAGQVAPAEWPVLLTGETGTGKTAIAEAIHEASGRPGRFVAINCAALAPTLLESELFGYVAGAFTGAARDSDGLFHQADRGTLFLDEIGDMTLDAQARLLRVVETGRVRRIGAGTEDAVDVRIVGATHRDLEDRSACGLFRQDLYYRIGAFVVDLPPLRERGADIDALADMVVAAAAGTAGKAQQLADDAKAVLRGHAWPGNLRELQSVLRQATVAAGDSTTIAAAHLPSLEARTSAPMIAAPTGPALPAPPEPVVPGARTGTLIDHLRHAIAAPESGSRAEWAHFLIAWAREHGSVKVTRPAMMDLLRDLRGPTPTDNQLRNEWNRSLRERLIDTGLVDHHRRALVIDIDACKAAIHQPVAGEAPPAIASETAEDRHAATAPLRARQGNLPDAPPELVGRDADVTAAGQLLADGCQLLTLTGPGGVGKTSAALAIAYRHSPHADGSWFVDLTSAETADDVRDALAVTMGIPVEPQDAAEQIERALTSGGRLVVVLDNFEQLVDVARETVGRWAVMAPDVQWLVTSRVLLGLRGEQRYSLEPLRAPDLSDTAVDAASLEGYDSVTLFVNRAREAGGSFQLDDTVAPHVAAICATVGGVPLALEMAAARLRVLSPERLAARLGEACDLLRTSRRDLPPHQQAMRATLDWSFNLLDSGEQRAFVSLCAFRDGFTLEAAEAVIEPVLDGVLAIDALEGLIDKSFVRRPDPDSDRYRIIPVVREYGAQQLVDSLGDAGRNELVRRHAEWFRERSLDFADMYMVAPSREARVLGPERANLQLALENALALRDPDLAVPLVQGLCTALDVRGELHRGAVWLERVQELDLRPLDRLALRGRWVHCRLRLDLTLREIPPVINDIIENGPALVDDTADGRDAAVWVSRLHLVRARVAMFGFMEADVPADLDAADAIRPEGMGRVLAAETRMARARWARLQGNIGEALDLLIEAEQTARLARADRLLRQIVSSRYQLLLLAGDYDEALQLARTSRVDLSDPLIALNHTLTWSDLEVSIGDAERARELGETGRQLARRSGLPLSEVAGCMTLMRVAIREGDTDDANRWLRECEEIRRRYGKEWPLRNVSALKAQLAIERHDPLTAREAALDALKLLAPGSTMQQIALVALAAAHLALGDKDEARKIVEQAVRLTPIGPPEGNYELGPALQRLEDLRKRLA